MATATEAPASTTAEGPTPHTQNQAEETAKRRGELSRAQIGYLLRGIDPMRVGKDGKGFAHVEAWDIRRHLIRIFGFGGHDTDMLEASLISETSAMRQKTGKNGPYGDPYEAWTVIYRVAVRLSVKVDGVELGHWHGIATGDASNQPSRADAHDLALKTADSQALKRAATNLGDQFGLSLYNKGSLEPVVQGSFAYLKPRSEQEFKDDKVEAEPDVAAAQQEAASAAAEPTELAPGPSEHLTKLMNQATDCWKSPGVLTQIKADGEEHQVLDEEFTAKDGSITTLRKVLDGRIAELQQQRSAA
jgi:recombination DNA repair RAD52 pathway protein